MQKRSILSVANSMFSMILLIMLSANAGAHPGHDHHHWMSGLYHSMSSLALVIVGFAILSCYLLKSYKIKQNKLQEDR